MLTAFQQVEDQLAAVPILTRELNVQTEAVKAAQQSVQIALNEYSAGTQNFTTVVTAEATELGDEESALSTRARAADGDGQPGRRARRRLVDRRTAADFALLSASSDSLSRAANSAAPSPTRRARRRA